jgi:hypothetical protein
LTALRTLFFVVAVWRAKEAESAVVKHWQATLVILTGLSASIALADDFKTINGKEYKNVTVSRVEPDGIVLKTKSGISKIYFVELPKEVQQHFHYDPQKVGTHSADQTPVPHLDFSAPLQSGLTLNIKTKWGAVQRKWLRSYLQILCISDSRFRAKRTLLYSYERVPSMGDRLPLACTMSCLE